ncbi:hypothetical protein OFC53_31230, partial [Escherichia coli]|nr:hypothetical protein [Escherichia coli]
MISSKEDYKSYLLLDEKAMRLQGSRLKNIIFNDIWRFLRLLRRLEYLTNCKGNKVLILITRLR